MLSSICIFISVPQICKLLALPVIVLADKVFFKIDFKVVQLGLSEAGELKSIFAWILSNLWTFKSNYGCVTH